MARMRIFKSDVRILRMHAQILQITSWISTYTPLLMGNDF
jgi:hypothetical protein